MPLALETVAQLAPPPANFGGKAWRVSSPKHVDAGSVGANELTAARGPLLGAYSPLGTLTEGKGEVALTSKEGTVKRTMRTPGAHSSLAGARTEWNL